MARDGGGALMSQGIHTVDLLLWMCGPVVRVSAATASTLHRLEVEDTVVATLAFESGAVGTLEVTTAAYPGQARRIELSGSEGTIIVEGDNVTSLSLRHASPTSPPGEGGNASASASSAVVTDVRPHRRIIEDFMAAVRDHRAPLCSGADARGSVALIEAIYTSARTGSAASPSIVSASATRND
ncbi:MAG: Gfo/Idh/MocA family oxidoreductase [Gemmatimonadaceae bacterium]|nr:Gfo/Idh/MocA family oxidoreductase [Gemmatimonadaceae bacterium]